MNKLRRIRKEKKNYQQAINRLLFNHHQKKLRRAISKGELVIHPIPIVEIRTPIVPENAGLDWWREQN